MSLTFRANMMKLVAITFGVYSLLWALAPFDAINLPARLILDSADWPIDSLSIPLDRNTQWLSSIAAGLLAMAAIFLGKVVVPAIKENNQQIISATIKAIGSWYVIDGIGSIAAGVYSNVAFNTVYLLLVLIPLLGKK